MSGSYIACRAHCTELSWVYLEKPSCLANIPSNFIEENQAVADKGGITKIEIS